MIIDCICSHLAQDGLHGKGRRVANLTGKMQQAGVARCTVCERERRVGVEAKEANVGEVEVNKGGKRK